MHWIDWLIVIVPLAIVAVVAFRTQRYVKGVSDFLAAGRVAGRYVVSIADGAAILGLVSAVAIFEMYYKVGFAISWWGKMAYPVSMLIVLTGFAIYRYRETRAMTLAQFLEIRYSKNFRILAGLLQSISGIINYGLFPAVGARFIMYFCDLPTSICVLNMNWPTIGLLMGLFLGIAVIITVLGGQITVMVTDCIQGILSYPMYLIVVVAILVSFSWHSQMAPTLLDRPEGKSLLNPFDTYRLEDFNLFYVFVSVISGVFNILSHSVQQSYNAAAASPHEQKMGKILGTWRGGFCSVMFVLLAVVAYTYINNDGFAEEAAATERNLSWKALNDVARSEKFNEIREEVNEYFQTGKMNVSLRGRLEKVRTEEAEAAKERVANDAVNKELVKPNEENTFTIIDTALKSEDKSVAQTFRTIHGQMRVPVAVRDILPIGVTGVFCAVMIFLMISTDTTYLHTWGSILVQDIFLPLRKKPFKPKQQLFWLRIAITSVAIYAFFFSLYFGQVTYILMFFAITGAIWLGGAGVVILGGLYWKRGTTAGAWVGLLTGSTLAILGLIGMNFWVGWIYPMLARWPEVLSWVTRIVEGMSAPFRPIIDWRVTPDRFPINGQEMLFITMLMATLTYVVISLLTCREPFNMDRMLHRGKYRRADQPAVEKPPRSLKMLLRTMLGIDAQYTRGDKILAWSVFLYVVVWNFGVSFVLILLWNIFKEGGWPKQWWSTWFFIQYFIVTIAIGLISTVWFTIGGTLGLRQLFKRLATHQANILDDGRVIGHVNVDDISMVEKVEHTQAGNDEAEK